MVRNEHSGSKQRGLSLVGLIFILFILVVVGIFSLKLIPAYIEYFKAKAAIEAIAADRSRTASPTEVRKAFDARATIDDIETVKASDLEITKDGNDVVINFAYRKEVKLFANVGLFVDFAASSKPE
jgi:Tfp pilus assembly protein PilE